MKKLSLLIILLISALSAAAQVPVDSLHEADLLFVVNPQGNSITSVTHGTQGLSIDHVAIFHRMASGTPSVIEAVGRGVTMLPLDSFRREQASPTAPDALVIVGRICVPGFDAYQSITRTMRQLGKPYDYYYEPTDSAIYCSELVTQCFVDSAGHTVLKTVPMEFRDKEGQIPEFWVRHYAARGLPVPEGAPGSNPGELSRRPQVTILGPLNW